MAIRIPGNPKAGVSEIRATDSGKIYSIARVFRVNALKSAQLVWEQTTFVDCNGKAFYDSNGIPFQGKKG